MTQLQGLSSIAGEQNKATTGSTFYAINPATGQAIDPVYHSASSDDVDRAALMAAEAFIGYRKLSGAKRAEFLRAIATNIEAMVDELVDRVGQETSLPEPRVRGEAGRTCGQLRLFATLAEEGSWVDARIDPAMPEREPLPRPDVRSMLRPLGPVAVFGASNFPLAFSVAGGDTASALAAGCTVVVKAHPAHPGTSEMIGQAIQQAAESTGMPKGVFSLLFDSGIGVGEALVRHPAIEAVGFTGSLRAGRALFDLAASRPQPIPVYAEMGSVNPQFLLPAALASRGAQIAEGLHQSATLGVGQFCTKPGIVFYDGTSGFRDRLISLFKEHSPGCMLTPGIAKGFAAGSEQLDSNENVSALVPYTPGDAASGAGAALYETDLDSLLADSSLREECFGPTVLLVRYHDKHDLVQAAAALEGQLTASVHAEADELTDMHGLLEMIEQRVGRMTFNQFPTGVEVNHAMVHGGPYPATTDSRTTSVGATAIFRFARPVCYQNVPDELLPAELKAGNPLGIRRLTDGKPE